MRIYRLVPLLIAATFSVHAETAAETREVDLWNLSVAIDGDPIHVAREAVRREWQAAGRRRLPDLRAESERESLAGRHVFLRQYLDGKPVLNGGASVTMNGDGIVTSMHDRTARSSDLTRRITPENALSVVSSSSSFTMVGEPHLVGWIHDDGVARLAWRVVSRDGYNEWATLVDAASGELIQTEPLFYSIEGRIFDPNPVTALNQPALRDNDDSADAVPDNAYVTATIEGVTSEEQLVGPHVTVTDVEAPTTTRAKPSAGLVFDRSQDEFEEVMAYVHIDRSQRYIQSLGFAGPKGIVAYSLPVDSHGGGGADNSYYRFSTPGRGRLVFGDGGVDDAEDGDIILHEYGHAIQDSIVPAGFAGIASSEARAMGEGFGDYWAFSSSYAANLESGADPFCVGNWDALCGEGPSSECAYPIDATCLRRVDGEKTMDDYLHTGGGGTEHRNGEIWSSALRSVFLDAVSMSGIEEGRRLSDRTILESHFGMPPNPAFRTAAIRLLDADRRLNGGLLQDSICTAMTLRMILTDDDCSTGLRGDVTTIQSPARGALIPPGDPAGVDSTLAITDSRLITSIYVAVDVRHPRRGDLRLTLTGPDGTSVVIRTENGDSDSDIVATYGLDTEPSQPLAPFHGLSAAGTWTLNVTNNRGDIAAELRSWSLLVRFEGDEPLSERGRPEASRLHVPVAGKIAGASGTRFVSDLRIFNKGQSAATLTLIYTPSGTDGAVDYDAISLFVAPGQVVALDDVIGKWFRTAGVGSIEIRGNTDQIFVTSRIYNDQPEGTFGQFFVAPQSSNGASHGDDPLHLGQLRNTARFRSNLGVAEIDGGTGTVAVSTFDAAGSLISVSEFPIAAYGHFQVPLFGGIGGTVVNAARAEVVVKEGDAVISAYGSTVDNLSGDAVFIPDVRLLRQTSRIVVPAVIHAPGAEGTSWRSDLWLFNRMDATVVLQLAYHPSGGGSTLTSSVTLAPGELRLLDDVVFGTFATEGTGSVEVTSDSLSSVIVSSRAWNDASTGSFGQLIEGIPAGDAIGFGGEAGMIHIDADSTYRANVGLTEIDGAPVVARVRLLDASGAEVFATTVEVGARGNVQFNLALAEAPPTLNGRVVIEVISGSGRLFGYGSVVDNRTGDAIYIPAR